MYKCDGSWYTVLWKQPTYLTKVLLGLVQYVGCFQDTVQRIQKRMVGFRKSTRNLFLTLHGHNVHRQQRQLSKFLMCYQQFASHAYCGVAGPVSKMASQQEKAFCVLRFEVSISVITMQREFRAARFRKYAPCMVRLF